MSSEERAPDPTAARRWQRVRAVFEQAVDLDARAREALLAREFGDDADLRAEVARLLAAESETSASDAFLTPPGADTLGAALPEDRFGPAPGDRMGPYELVAELGQGGQGAVWSATDTRVARRVALKLLPSGTSWTAAGMARFRREAAITARLEHPGICTVYDVDLDGAQPYVAMRLVEGESLATTLDRARAGTERIDAGAAVRWIEQAARALDAAHRVGVVHRDVKPGNLMRTPDDDIVVLDFGIARELDEQGTQLTRTGDVFGTPAYMAPEQIEGRAADARVDVWALGATLFELVTLQQAFREPTREALYRAILSRDPAANATVRELPRDLRVVLATALEKDPERRYASALDLADDLAAYAAGRPIAARPVGAFGRLWRWARREPRAALATAAVAVALLVAAGAAGYLANQQGRLEAGDAALAQQRRDALVRDVSTGVIRLDSGEAQMREVLAEDPRLTSTRAVLALALADEYRFDAALELLAEAPADQEDPRAAARVRAIVLRKADRADEAHRLEGDLGTPRSALEAYFASLAAQRDGEPDGDRRALEHIRRALTFMPGPSETYLERLLLCSFRMTTPDDRGELQRAAEALEQLYPESALAWFYIGLARSKTDPARAREATRRAIELDVHMAQPYVIEHVFLMAEGAFDEARELFERAIVKTPPNSEERQRLLLVRSGTCLQHERFAEALDAAERALAIRKPPVEALLHKARAQRGLGDPAADETLRQLLERDPDNAAAKAMLGG